VIPATETSRSSLPPLQVVVKHTYEENQEKLLTYLDWFTAGELATILPTGYTVVDNFTHLIATRCIVVNQILGQPSPLPWDTVRRYSRLFPPRPEDKPNPPRAHVRGLLDATYTRLCAGLDELPDDRLVHDVWDARYRTLTVAEKLVTQAGHEAYHIGMIGGYRALVVSQRPDPRELYDQLAANPCTLSNGMFDDSAVL
jgi:DinB superfamily